MSNSKISRKQDKTREKLWIKGDIPNYLCNAIKVSLPDEVIITPEKTADKKKLNNLIVGDSDVLNIFDRGYVDYKLFDEYCKKVPYL